MEPLDSLPPMLLDERQIAFGEAGWLWELKFDGYRMLAQFGHGSCELRTRNGADRTRWFPELAGELAGLPGGPYVVDGEVCVLDDIGRSSFERLQARARRRRWFEGADPVTFCVFDLLHSAGTSLLDVPLTCPKQELTALLQDRGPASSW